MNVDHLIDGSIKGGLFDWEEKQWNALEDRELSELTWDLFNVLKEFGMYKRYGFDKTEYVQSKKEFKRKWLCNREEKVKSVIDAVLDDARSELYDTFGIPVNLCNKRDTDAQKID